jgi:hypothetical protein
MILLLLLALLTTEARAACDVNIDSLSPEYPLDQANKTYCITADISSGSGSFRIKADGVTLDGQGHTISVPAEVVSVEAYSRVTVKNLKLLDGGINFPYQSGATDLSFLNNELDEFYVAEATKVTIRGNTVHGGLHLLGKAHCIDKGGDGTPVTCGVGKVQATDIWSDDDLVENNSFIGENLDSAVRLIQIANTRRFTFRNNHVELINGTGNIVQVHYSVDATFEGNRIITKKNPDVSDETYGLHIRDGTTRLTFRNNYVETDGTNCMLLGGSGNEIYLQGVNDTLPAPWGFGNLVQNNVFVLKASNIADAALRYDTSNGGDRFVNNIFYSEANTTGTFRAGATLPLTDPAIVQNNTVIAMADSPAFALIGNNQNGQYKLRNNIFFHNSPTGASISGAVPTSDSDYNLYFPANSAFLAREPHSIGSDPLFADLPNMDFRLQTSPESPAINAGDDGNDMGVNFTALSSTPADIPGTGSATGTGGIGVSGGCGLGSPQGAGLAWLLTGILPFLARRRKTRPRNQ